MIALCSGSFFLAAAGLLDGRRAATHWSVAHLLQQRYPSIQVDADAIYVRDGALWTSAGVTAGIDLALALFCAMSTLLAGCAPDATPPAAQATA